MKKSSIILGSLALVLTLLTSCQKDNEDTGTTTSSTTSTTNSSTTSGSTTASTTSSSTTSGSTTSSTTSTTSTTGSTGLSCSPTSSQVVIGTQTWNTTNLNVDKFRNGDTIPEAKTDAEWTAAGNAGTPAWCYYLNSPDSGAKYGKLYNWYAVNDSRGLAPDGWHIPSDGEWTVLTSYLGGDSLAGTKMKNACAWLSSAGAEGNGSNTSGFSGMPSGYCHSNGLFYFIGSQGLWWSSTESGTLFTWTRYLSNKSGNISTSHDAKSGGLSVRCIKD